MGLYLYSHKSLNKFVCYSTQNFKTFLKLEQLQVEIHVYYFEKWMKYYSYTIIAKNTDKKFNGNKKEDQLFKQNLMFIRNLHAKKYCRTPQS